ncbi:HAMP domain-containing sensor histidine kinase [Solwaraspora sp. WMMB335]|uniref:HAMP domain-containing sensor histidine kinase n=1 Tax=Solwaraspora sp. WMMB335 TaxID=3404118 RepID=UPI003B92AD7C
MDRRLVATRIGLLAILLGGLGVALAIEIGERHTRSAYLDQLHYTSNLADLVAAIPAEGSVVSADRPPAEAPAETGLESLPYPVPDGTAFLVLDAAGQPVARSTTELAVARSAIEPDIDTALVGRVSQPPPSRPWRGDPLVVVAPARAGADIVGVVVTTSRADGVRRTTLLVWAVLGVGVLLVVGVAAAAETAAARTTGRGVDNLTAAARAVASGQLKERAPVPAWPPELRRLTQSVNTAADQLVSLLERQRTFISYASHQLRTPLAPLRLGLSRLAGDVSEPGRDTHRMLSEEVDRLARVCEALLSFAQAQHSAVAGEEVDIVGMVERRVMTWRSLADERGVDLVCVDVPAAIPPAWISADILEQVLDVLIDNAIKYAGRGATVRLVVRQPATARIDVHVIDDGPGMSANELVRTGSALRRRGGGTGSGGGAGLGITIAQALITAAGGQLRLARAHPGGVDARIRVPAAAGPA